MSKVSAAKKQHRSMRGKQVDMDLLRKRNELTPAVGNARVNARGDELGPGGQIIKKREDVLRDFYEDNVEPTEFEQSIKAPEPEVAPEQTASVEVETPAPKVRKAGQTKAQAKVEDEWMEDEDGNFVKRGD